MIRLWILLLCGLIVSPDVMPWNCQSLHAGESETSGDFGAEYDAGGSNGLSSYRIFSFFDDEKKIGFFGAFIATQGRLPKLEFCCVLKDAEMRLDKMEFPVTALINLESVSIEKTVESRRWRFHVAYRSKFLDNGFRIAKTELVVGGRKFNLDDGRMIEIELKEHAVVFNQRFLDDDDLDDPADLVGIIFPAIGED